MRGLQVRSITTLRRRVCEERTLRMELNQQKLERDYSKTNDITGADYARTLVVCIIQVQGCSLCLPAAA